MSEYDGLHQELESWKRKYFTQLKETEDLERRATESEVQLRRSLSHMSLAADGSHPTLDRQLLQLRNYIRDGNDSTEVSQLVEQILELSSTLSKKSGGSGSKSEQDTLLQLLDSLSFPRGMARKVKSLQNQLNKTQKDISPAVKQFSELLENTFAWMASEKGGEEESPGLLKKFFSANKHDNKPKEEAHEIKRTTDESETQTQQVSDKEESEHQGPPDSTLLLDFVDHINIPGQGDNLKKLRSRLSSTKLEKDFHEILISLAEIVSSVKEDNDENAYTDEELAIIQNVLRQLLERLSIPEAFSTNLEAIQNQLNKKLSPIELIPLLKDIAELITKVNSLSMQEKSELEGFLQTITESLIEIDQQLLGSQADNKTAQESYQKLDSAMEVEVQGIKDTVMQATELVQLQTDIQVRLDTIRKHLATRRSEDEQRFKQLDQRFSMLRNQLTRVEGEADELRTKIKKKHEEALRDPLTGISNRLAYDERMEQEYNRWKRYGNELSMIIWDIDHFKKINDNYGHQAGDKVLRIVAQKLNEKIRSTDFIARFGGEEFIALLPETSLENARVAANSLRNEIADCEFHYSGKRVTITISCGIAQFHDGDLSDEVLERADKALYKAKDSGRNKCVTELEVSD